MQAVDLADARQALGGLPPAAITALVATFESDVAQLVEQMDGAWRNRDPAALRFAAYSLAGVSASFGARHLAALARRAMHAADLCNTEMLDPIRAEASLCMVEIRQVFAHQPA